LHQIIELLEYLKSMSYLKSPIMAPFQGLKSALMD